MLEIHLTRQQRMFHATLLADEAPTTCAQIEAMLAAAPVRGLSYHSIYSGQEFYVYCPPVDLPLENHVVWPRPGDRLLLLPRQHVTPGCTSTRVG